MTDAELIARLRAVCTCNIDSTPCMAEDDCRDAIAAADRIEALTKERDEQIEWVKRLADDLISAEAKLATCEKYRDAYDEMGRIGTQAVRDIEAKLAKAVELLEAWGDVAVHCSIEEGVCCCGDNMENHTNPMDCGHTPLDHGTYIAIQLAEKTRATLAEIKGESHD